jgi:benzoyl-CoA reductase subunit A
VKCYVGIDLGSTTTKAVVLDEHEQVLGRGITNSRSNYDLACAVARSEAFVNARFGMFSNQLASQGIDDAVRERLVEALARQVRREQHLVQQAELAAVIREETERDKYGDIRPDLRSKLDGITAGMDADVPALFAPGAKKRSDFFRDIATSGFMHRAEAAADTAVGFDVLMTVFDRSISQVESRELDLSFESNVGQALERALEEVGSDIAAHAEAIRATVDGVTRTALDEVGTVGTGYGRSKLPFRKDQIRSEILCHGLGAHWMFPETRTVLDIGGQDTKAIQVDGAGIVTSFQMNDRCAAGCGRYLGYIADEMNLGVHELGPIAQKSCRQVKINSTCTVFAGAELRDRLSLGDKREDVLAGLHRAMMLRAMSLLARSGGIDDEFTFTGGVARNPAAVEALQALVRENYGERTLNISVDSIYTGAVGAALFARRSEGAVKEEAA